MITDKARPYYVAMVDDLLLFYLSVGKGLSDTQLFMEISNRFGDRLLVEVCPYLDLDIGECTIGAIAVMKEAAGRAVHESKKS